MYDLDQQKIIDKIKQENHKLVLLQLPDGLKTRAERLVKDLEEETGATILIWFGSCFGACDLPVSAKNLGVDMIVALGHNRYIKDAKGW